MVTSELRDLQGGDDQHRDLFAWFTRIIKRIQASSSDLPSVLQGILDGVCEITEARHGALAVFDSSGRIRELFTHGITLEGQERPKDPQQDLAFPGWPHQLQESSRLADLPRHLNLKDFSPNHSPLGSIRSAPMRLGDETIGSLFLAEKGAGRAFTSEDEQLLALFASQATIVIRNDRQQQQLQKHIEEAERAAREMGILHGLSQVAVSTVDLVEILARALPLVLEGTGADAAEIWLVNPETGMLELRAQQGESREPLFERRGLKLGEGLLGIAAQSLQSVISQDLSHELRFCHKQVMGAEFGSFCAFPMVSQGRPLGVLCVACGEAECLWDHHNRLLARMADALAIAIRNAQLFARVEQLAEERQKLLVRTERQRRRLEVLVDISPVGVFVANTSGRVVLMNREAERILGLARQPEGQLERLAQAAVYRRPDGRVYEPEELPLRRALYHGESTRAEEIRFELPDGRTIPTLVNATPVLSAEGELTGAIAVIQDITPLEELEKLRSEFLGVVSHELKTPLTAIKGSAATVLGSRRPFAAEEIRELFQIVDEQADRLRELVNNLLDMTRIEAGSFSISPEPLDLQGIFEETLAAFTRSAGSHEVQLKFPDDLPLVKADRLRVLQVLTNLLSNAAKFSFPAAPITIAVEHDASYVTIHVQDQGRGIPKEGLPHLFKKFSQVHEEAGHKLGGSGLGLAICKGIVEAHGGRIWAESPGEGHGATFSFNLPVAPSSSLPDTARRAHHLGRVGRPSERTRVLVVDDEPGAVRYLRRVLDEAGYKPIVTTDPSQVTKLVELEEPDLILLDLRLPGTSGFELLQRIREFSGVPVIFVTASSKTEDAVRALKMGADDYITKPFSPAELLARVEAALRRRVLPDVMETRALWVLDDLNINFAERRVTVGGQVVSLSATEYKLLYELATHAGQVLTHNQILQRVWGPDYGGETELVRSFIRRLRRKLGDDARTPRYILTERQVGYRMRKPQSLPAQHAVS